MDKEIILIGANWVGLEVKGYRMHQRDWGQCKMSVNYTSTYAWLKFAYMKDIWMIMIYRCWHSWNKAWRDAFIGEWKCKVKSLGREMVTYFDCLHILQEQPFKEVPLGKTDVGVPWGRFKRNSRGSLLPRVSRRYLRPRFFWEDTYYRGLLGNLLPRLTRESTIGVHLEIPIIEVFLRRCLLSRSLGKSKKYTVEIYFKRDIPTS